MEKFEEFKIKYRKISESVSQKGNEIYQKIKDNLEKDYKGKYIIIEPESEEYIIGDDKLELVKKARQKFPDKIFNVKRIGYKVSGYLRYDKRLYQ